MAQILKGINYLRKDELANELSHMGISVDSETSVVGLRNELRTAHRLIRRGSIKANVALPADAAAELAICEPKVRELEDIIPSGDFTSNSNCRLRVAVRANYLLTRLTRCGLDCPELVNIRQRLIKVVSVAEPSGESDSEGSEDDNPSSQVQMGCAREVTKPRLLMAFSDLLDGPALSWFRTNKASFNSYEDLLSELRDTFDIPDYDYRLRNEIRQRTQARSESLVNYICTMQAMFSRLSCRMPSDEQLDILMHNIRPDYMKELALHEVNSIDDLRRLGKRLELARARAEAFNEPVLDKFEVSSDLHQRKDKSAPKPMKQVSAVETQAALHERKCFRCEDSGHTAYGCTRSKDVVCFRCGLKGVKTPECSQCSSHSKNA